MNKNALCDNAFSRGHRLLSYFIAGSLALCSLVAYSQTDSSAEDGIQDLAITVESGDTFTGIITRELKSLDAWGTVARHNNLDSPDNLKPGDVIIIPAEVLRLRNYATVVYVKGTAVHHNQAKNTRANVLKGAKIYPGDSIETAKDGFVSMSFKGGTSVNIQPDSELKIKVLECIDTEEACEIDLGSNAGKLELDVKSVGFSKPTVFSIDTPYASAAVRGTSFDFDINEGNVLGVTEGIVEISINGSSNQVNLGKGVLAGEGRSINELFDLLLKPNMRLRDGTHRVSDEDIISWESVTDADKYLLAYAQSESMQDIVTSATEEKTISKPNLSPGEYYLTNRAVDRNGLRGFNSKHKLIAAAIDEKAVAPELEIEVSGSQMKITASGSPSDIAEVQVGNLVVTVNEAEYLLGLSQQVIKGGESITVEYDPAKEWYLQSRKVVDETTVSPYGFLYFLDKSGN